MPYQKITTLLKQVNAVAAKNFQTLGVKNIDHKKDNEIVTATDKKINKIITDKLLKLFPNDSIVSEEAKVIKKESNKAWYIDPIDGTTNFSYGIREFAICLALTEKEKIIFGAIGLPLANEIYRAENGKAFLNNKKIKVSDKTTGRDGHNLIFVCDGHSPKANKKFFEIIGKINVAKYRIRVFSSAGVELAGVATGRADGAILPEVHPWDVLAGVLLVRNAGGRATNFKGEEWNIKDTTLIVSNGQIHDYLLKLVR